MSIEIFKIKPGHFNDRQCVDVVGCFVENQDKVLFLQRAPGSVDPYTWCIPGGKVEKGETIEKAVIRELFEETSIRVLIPLQFMNVFYCIKPEVHFAFHVFKLKLSEEPTIELSKEHLDFKWATLEGSKQLNHISGGQEIILECFDFISV